MKNVFWLLLVLSLSGCRGFNRLVGTEKTEDKPHGYHVVACCRDRDSSGFSVWPSFVPQAQRDFCRRVELANHNDEFIDNDIYLSIKGDCSHDSRLLGGEYYAGKNY